MKKYRRRLLLLLLAAFATMNAVAFFHAWRFTHFSNEAGLHSPNPEQLGASQKLWLLLAGIRNPKLANDFSGVGHEPYWKRYSADWQQQTRTFLRRE